MTATQERARQVIAGAMSSTDSQFILNSLAADGLCIVPVDLLTQITKMRDEDEEYGCGFYGQRGWINAYNKVCSYALAQPEQTK